LVNDATALVVYRFALAAVSLGVFSLPQAIGKFFILALGGVGIGFLVGKAGLWLMPRLRDVHAQTVMSFITAFGAYVLGESAGVSGVISTVTAGLCFGRWLPGIINPQTRIESKANWELVLFVINAFVFTMIGLQLPVVVRNLTDYSWKALLLYAVALNVTVIVMRFLWVFPATYLPRFLIPAIARKDPSPRWEPVVILGWMGMRGIVSLAAALALPDAFPHRSLLIFLTYTVILVTLILPPLTLPTLLRILNIHSGNEHAREEALARHAATKSVLDQIDGLKEDKGFSIEQIDTLRLRYERRPEKFRT
jgi:CPA1 family monovalent cation:H+ antiporter